MTTTTEPFRARAIGLSLTANDLEKSVAWYTDVVGFTINRRHERDGRVVAVSLQAGDTAIVIGRDDGAKGLNRVKGAGCSFQFTTDQDVNALADGIKARGGTLATEPEDSRWGARVFRIKDPDGFTLVVSSIVKRD